MEPNKFENQIREKLNAREITPSASSWDRLDAMLSVAEKKKPKHRLSWLYIAAGIVGFIFASLFFFNQNQENPIINNNQTVVESNANKVNAEKEKVTDETALQADELIKPIKNRTEIKNVPIVSVSKTANEPVNGEIIKREIIAEAIPQKTEEIVKEAVNKDPILALNETNKTKANSQKPKLKIDANALLSQVDNEIELTFRQKALKKIAKNLESAREAVVSRNQE